jgi:hypothetical protein
LRHSAPIVGMRASNQRNKAFILDKTQAKPRL